MESRTFLFVLDVLIKLKNIFSCGVQFWKRNLTRAMSHFIHHAFPLTHLKREKSTSTENSHSNSSKRFFKYLHARETNFTTRENRYFYYFLFIYFLIDEYFFSFSIELFSICCFTLELSLSYWTWFLVLSLILLLIWEMKNKRKMTLFGTHALFVDWKGVSSIIDQSHLRPTFR